MSSTATSVDQYLEELPLERKAVVEKLRSVILKNLPKGFKEVMGYGMPCYVVPHSVYPAGYHCNPKQPLPFISLASTKSHIALHHLGLYGMPDLFNWFVEAYSKNTTTKPDIGKGCIRFKKPELIPYDLVGELCRRVTVEEWIKHYEQALKK